MTKQFLKDYFLWGSVLWLVGYVLGIILFPFVPSSMIGWAIMPIGLPIMLWVLSSKIKGTGLKYFFMIGTIWTFIAVILDYLLLVMVFHPVGYYKADVYFYYALTFLVPILFGLRKIK
jgi:hypothetical protein